VTDAITIQNPRNRGGNTGHVLAKRSVTFTEIRNRWGRGTLQPGRIAKPVEWAMRRELLSPAYTTRWSELMVAKAN